MNKLIRNRLFQFGLCLCGAGFLVVALFPGFFRELVRGDQFMPHATCYLRNPKVIFLHVSSDLFIGLAYVSISSTLAFLVRKASKDIPFHWMFLAFGLFIITCGFTHFMEVWTVWYPVYWLAGYVKVICAAASVATAIALFPLVPKIFGLIKAVEVSEERKTKLEMANAELETFAYSVSHDLRAPLRAMQGMSTALVEDFGSKLEPEARDYLDRITAAATRMDGMIRDMLEYSRVSRAECELAPVDLVTVVKEAQAALASDTAQTEGNIHVEAASCKVVANPLMLRQALTNLLQNALKFVAPGVRPEVKVAARQTGDRVRLEIRDNGIGIAPEHQQKIFRIFERLHSASEYPGTGIGLAIVQKAIVRMNGSLGLESAPGAGSCFWVELPKA